MKLFRHLILFGAVLVTLLFIIESIDARKKETKRKEVETNYENEIGNSKSGRNGKLKKSENGKLEKSKKNEYRTLNPEESLNKEKKLEANKNIGKKGKKSIKNGKNTKENVNPKITKTYQKVKKYKIVEDVPAKKFSSNKKIPKKGVSQQTYKQEVMDEVLKSVTKTTQKNPSKVGNSKNGGKNEEPKELNEEETIFVEEGDFGKSQKRKAYKLVEVVLEEEDENPEGNETIVEVGLEDEDEVGGIQRTESEEVIEKYKTTQTLKFPKTKKSSIYNTNNEDGEEEFISDSHLYDNQEQQLIENDVSLDEESYSSRYEDPHDPNTLQKCKPIPEDANRQGPKKLTLYVIEEEVDGQIKKRVVSEEDGVTMCEVADLLQEHYYSGLE